MAQSVRRLKEGSAPSLYFDSGDVIKSGNLAIPIQADPAWPLLEEAGCDASVPGNRESHVLASAFEAKINGCRHPLLCANLYDKEGSRVLPASHVFDLAGVKVGVFGLMVPMVTQNMASRFASAYLWTQPVKEAASVATELRAQCDILIALTHIGFSQDVELARANPEIDVILGGHSHTVLSEPVREGTTWICQGGSHGRFIGNYIWDGALRGGLQALPES